MKICAIICEYNPFHNGHLHQLNEAKRLSGADAILCLMSGNFVQRGEAAILNKFIRAKHALLAGADVVVELPVPFATSNAEIFAKGAVKLLSSIPAVTHLAFGAEHADKDLFLEAAKIFANESRDISEKIKLLSAKGISYAKARAQAYESVLPQDLLTSPNDILGIEYTKALFNVGSNIKILPIPRIGGGYRTEALQDEFSSATAIRAALSSAERQNIETSVPSFVFAELPKSKIDHLEVLEKAALLQKSAHEIQQVCDCTEGLENAFKKAAESTSSLVETLTSARYTSSRIRRISLQNLLNITRADVERYLSDDLYIYPLAYRRESKALLAALSEGRYPLLTGAREIGKLSDAAEKCRQINHVADKIYALATETPYQSKVIIL